MLKVFACFSACFTFTFAIYCNLIDLETGETGECLGDYCMYAKVTVMDGTLLQIPTIVQGCLNRTKLSEKNLGCFKGSDDLDSSFYRNATVCICNSDRCNTEKILSHSAPNSNRMINCKHSTHQTCKGYACETKFTQISQKTSIFRTCSPHLLDTKASDIKLSATEYGIESNCIETLEYNDTVGFYTEKVCSCYKENCNEPSNDAFIPALKAKSLECSAQACNSSHCIKMAGNVCKGQYCSESK